MAVDLADEDLKKKKKKPGDDDVADDLPLDDAGDDDAAGDEDSLLGDDDLFADIDDESEMDAAGEDADAGMGDDLAMDDPIDAAPPADPAAANPDPAAIAAAATPDVDAVPEQDLLRSLVGETAEMGIVVPDGVKNCRDFCEHLHTAIQTHKATKATLGGGPQEATAQSQPPAPTEEAPPMMMSTASKNETTAQHALARAVYDRRLRRLARLEKSGAVPAIRLSTLRKAAQKVTLRFDAAGHVLPEPVDDQIVLAAEVLRAAGGQPKTAKDAARLSLTRSVTRSAVAKARAQDNPMASDDAAVVDRYAELFTSRRDTADKKK